MNNLKIKLTTFCMLSLLFVSCEKISDQAKGYLDQVLDIMEKNSINKYTIDWKSFRKEVFKTVSSAETIKDTYPGIRTALILLDDHHSFFQGSDGTTIYSPSYGNYEQDIIILPKMPDDIGYVKVISFSGQSTDASIAFANQIQSEIKRQDHSGLIGWIVDLRNNGGGNMWPMLAGIGPILGEGIAGYFIDPDGREISWGFQNGASVSNGYPVVQLSDSYHLLVPKPKVAVLLNQHIASSGEAIAVSFIGRENTKSFGSATYGLSTSNQSFTLSDKARLYLTTAYFADRNKKKYGARVQPDMTSSKETVIDDAIAWIRNQID